MKSFLKSKGIWGATVGILVSVWAILMEPSNYDKAEQCLTIFGQTKAIPTITLISSLVAYYGRMTATRALYSPKGVFGNDPPVMGDPRTKLR